ncbi:hypothetical protein GCM10018980_36190 [Streptomyces capoamus]|uniref:Uncharacterized protein n=1 Tax=Streptomyces capoamus TaxID=68183 RepID=A0A919EXB5_9ACTN|nr:hypothetical protein [Streptomyces capoamus]GGW20331.1 hypothetical protein GCM10010501_64870 [Streptomyces libani subsp. rufus]GHG52709.1 hypothetical protein GCM10018980_36190 [Streptomyces capoamus]
MKGFTGFTKRQDVVLVIRDSDLVAAALRDALDAAPEEERAGLERAAAVVGETAGASEGRLRADWVRTRLADVGFTGEVASISALKALRQAEPQLSLLAAVQLQKEAVTHPA